VPGVVFGEAQDNLNDQSHYSKQFTRLIFRRCKRNKAGVLHRAFAVALHNYLYFPLGIATKIVLQRSL